MADQSFSPGFEYTLIELVRTRPVLYDRSIYEFRNKNVREHKWAEIIEILKSKGYEVKDRRSLEERWRLLRNRFHRLSQCLSDEKPNFDEGKWPFYNSLRFLKGHRGRRPSIVKSLPPVRVLSPLTPCTSTQVEVSSDAETPKRMEFAFIELVKERPIIYDHDDPAYRKPGAKAGIWQEIFDILKSKGYDVTDPKMLGDKWRFLRNRFHSICREIPSKMSGGPGTVIKVRWPFFGPLLFLKDHLRQKQTRPNSQFSTKITSSPTPCTSTRGGETNDDHATLTQSEVASSMDDTTSCDDTSTSGDSISIHSENPVSTDFSQLRERNPSRIAEMEKELLTFITNASSAIAKIREKGNVQPANEARTFSDFVASALHNMDKDLMNTTMEAISEVIFSAKRQAQTYDI